MADVLSKSEDNQTCIQESQISFYVIKPTCVSTFEVLLEFEQCPEQTSGEKGLSERNFRLLAPTFVLWGGGGGGNNWDPIFAIFLGLQ